MSVRCILQTGSWWRSGFTGGHLSAITRVLLQLQFHRPKARQSSQWPGDGMQARCNVAGRPACQQQRPSTHCTAPGRMLLVRRRVLHVQSTSCPCTKQSPTPAMLSTNPANPCYVVNQPRFPRYHMKAQSTRFGNAPNASKQLPAREHRPSRGAVTITLHDLQSWLHNKQGWRVHVCTHTQTCMHAHIGNSEAQQQIGLHGAGQYCRGTALSVLTRTGR